jgi:hypothetical protein
MDILAEKFANDDNLAKLAAGDLSADITALSKDAIKNKDGDILFDVEAKIEDFKKTRSDTMDKLNERYNNVFESTGTEEIMDGEETKVINNYTQSTYEAAQATLEFEESVEALGTETKQNLTSAFLALKSLEEGVDLEINNKTKKIIKGFDEAGISADKL